MKKSKKILALMLAATMCVPITACGGKESGKKELDKYDATVEETIKHSIYQANVIDGVMYAGYEDYIDKGEDYSSVSGFVVYDFESGELKEKELEIDGDGDVYSPAIYLDEKGNIVAEYTVSDFSDDTKNIYHEEKAYYNSALELVNKEVGEKQEYEYDDDMDELKSSYKDVEEEETTISEEETSASDEETSASDEESDVEENDSEADEAADENYEYVSKTLMVAGKKVSFIYSNDSYIIRRYDENGEAEAEVKTDEYLDTIIATTDGNIYVIAWGDDGEEIRVVDFEKGEIGEKIVKLNGYSVIGATSGKDNTILLYTDSNLVRCDVKNKKIENILKFIDCDISSDSVIAVYGYENGDYAVVQNLDEKVEITRLKKQTENSVNKTEITLGVLFMDYDLKEKVIEYNKASKDTRIKIVEYMDEDTEYEDAIKKMNNDIASGNCPDLIDFNSGVASYKKYAEKGLLEDLVPYFEKDADLSLDDMVESVVNAYKIGDKLYVLPSAFYVEGIVGATDVVGEDSNWTVQEFVELANSLEDGQELFNYCSREMILYYILFYNIDEYVDWSKGECNFNSEEFIKILELSKNYKSYEDEDYSYGDEEEIEGETSKLRNGKLLLRQEYLYDVNEYLTVKAMYGKDITFKGVPCKGKTGICIETFSSNVAMSSKSKNKDKAWEFLRQLYLPDEENEADYYASGFSIRQDKVDEMLKYALNSKDENSHDVDGYELEIPKATEKDIEEIKEIINSADTIPNIDEEIYNIIKEEAESFYSGQKSAKEVADVIQSRASIFVKENK